MFEWIQKMFKNSIFVFFVLGIILTTIFGGILGYDVGGSIGYYDDYEVIGCIIGIVVGVVVGLFLNTLVFGFYVTMLQMSATITEIKDKLEKSLPVSSSEKAGE